MAEPFTRQSVSMPLVMLSDLKEEAKRRDLTLSQLNPVEYVRHGRLRDAQSGVDLKRDEGRREEWQLTPRPRAIRPCRPRPSHLVGRIRRMSITGFTGA